MRSSGWILVQPDCPYKRKFGRIKAPAMHVLKMGDHVRRQPSAQERDLKEAKSASTLILDFSTSRSMLFKLPNLWRSNRASQLDIPPQTIFQIY